MCVCAVGDTPQSDSPRWPGENEGKKVSPRDEKQVPRKLPLDVAHHPASAFVATRDNVNEAVTGGHPAPPAEPV